MEVWMAELAAMLLILACIAHGAYQGLLLKIYSLVKIVLLIVGTAVVAPLLLTFFPKTVDGREVFAFIVALILVSIVLGIVANALRIVDHIPVVNKLNKLGGAVAGAFVGILLIWLLLLVLELCGDASWCQEVNQAVSKSEMLAQMQRMNPLLKILFNLLK